MYYQNIRVYRNDAIANVFAYLIVDFERIGMGALQSEKKRANNRLRHR